MPRLDSSYRRGLFVLHWAVVAGAIWVSVVITLVTVWSRDESN
ncbi:MAG TPA: hypothetical protein VN515_08355 [Terriglobales bacterium]|nr:hypothetical protein [Terriglobales bacterium]